MKTELTYLPDNKQQELSDITTMIVETVPAELVILFGSYARNNWVEEKYDAQHYRYQSDFDVLVLVATKIDHLQSKFERSIEEKLERMEAIHTPVCVLVHGMDFVNRRLNKAQYFFTDIKREGVLLYDSGRHTLNEAKALLPAERQHLAKEDFDYWFKKADAFYQGFEFMLRQENHSEAAFLLHQVVERLYSGILLVFTRYKPNTHDLATLRKLVHSVESRLSAVFPLETPEDRELFKLLRKAYVDARYKRGYCVTPETLAVLAHRVTVLRTLGDALCQEKIQTFVTP